MIRITDPCGDVETLLFPDAPGGPVVAIGGHGFSFHCGGPDGSCWRIGVLLSPSSPGGDLVRSGWFADDWESPVDLGGQHKGSPSPMAALEAFCKRAASLGGRRLDALAAAERLVISGFIPTAVSGHVTSKRV